MQNVKINCDALRNQLSLMIIFGINDNMQLAFNHVDWTILNNSWLYFSQKTLIKEFDLWDANMVSLKLFIINL